MISRTKAAEKREIRTDIAKAGEGAMANLMSHRAREIVALVHSNELEALGAVQKKDLRDEINALLSQSDAAHLVSVETDVVSLRCQGDPYDLGKITNLYSALSDCRDYLSMRLEMNAAPKGDNIRIGSLY
jgi:hypothetical protein